MSSMKVRIAEEHKAALSKRAQMTGGSLSDEVRKAIDFYLFEATADDVAALDAASRQAEADLARMQGDVREMRDMLRSAFAEIEAIRAGRTTA